MRYEKTSTDTTLKLSKIGQNNGFYRRCTQITKKFVLHPTIIFYPVREIRPSIPFATAASGSGIMNVKPTTKGCWNRIC